MDQDLTQVVAKLTEHESQLKNELNEITSKANAISKRLTQVQSALTALLGSDHSTKTCAKAKPNGKAPTPAAIEETIVGILREKKGVQYSELFRMVKERITQRGHSRMGLKSHFSKIISNPKFKADQDSIVTLA
jgi:DNA gyrase/topoisomerase IV subunit A